MIVEEEEDESLVVDDAELEESSGAVPRRVDVDRLEVLPLCDVGLSE